MFKQKLFAFAWVRQVDFSSTLNHCNSILSPLSRLILYFQVFSTFFYTVEPHYLLNALASESILQDCYQQAMVNLISAYKTHSNESPFRLWTPRLPGSTRGKLKVNQFTIHVNLGWFGNAGWEWGEDDVKMGQIHLGTTFALNLRSIGTQ